MTAQQPAALFDRLQRIIRGARSSTRSRDRADYAGKPSYIPARTFALALLDSLAPATDGPITPERLRQRAMELATTAAEDVQKLIANLPDFPEKDRLMQAADGTSSLDAVRAVAISLPASSTRDQIITLIDQHQAIGRALLSLIDLSRSPVSTTSLMKRVSQMIADLPDTVEKAQIIAALASRESIDSIRAITQKLPMSETRTAVLDLIDFGETSIEGLCASIESWYDHTMDRVSDVYQRRVQMYLFVIALAVCIFIGVDSLRMISTLSTNTTRRAFLIAWAGQANALVAPPTPSSPAIPGTPTLPQAALDEIGKLGVIFGYDDEPERWSGDWWNWLLYKFLGLMMTAFAVSFGAPFWFDVLNRVANLRATGPPPVKAESMDDNR